MAKWPIVKPRGLHKKWKITLPPPGREESQPMAFGGKNMKTGKRKNRKILKKQEERGKKRGNAKTKGQINAK
jgi:hypothetical protein